MTLIAYSATHDFTNRHGSIQGGFLAAMLDSAAALALLSALPDGFTAVTKRLVVDYLRPAHVGEYVAKVTFGPRDTHNATMMAELNPTDGGIVAKAVAELRILRLTSERPQ